MRYDERLAVPLRWWVLAGLFLASLLAAFLVSTPLWLALTGTGVLVALVATVLGGYGAARVSVGQGVFSAGRARIGLEHVGAAVALDAEQSRRVAGVDADARAYLLLRPYLSRAVQVPITDPADPTPYWLVSTRAPERLVAALRQEGAGSMGGA